MKVSGRFNFWRMVAMAMADEGGAGGGEAAAADPAVAADAGAESGTKPSLASAAFADPPADAAVGEADAAVGEKKEGDQAAGEEAQGDAEPFELAPAEGLEAFKEDYSSYSKAGQDFLGANPKASAREALAWAAQYQADQVRNAGKAMQERFNGTISKWEADCVNDPRIGGGDQAKYTAEIQTYYAGLKAVGTPELVKVLDESGLGSHPEIFAAFAKIGRSAQESPILGGEGGKGSVSFADGLYGKKG